MLSMNGRDVGGSLCRGARGAGGRRWMVSRRRWRARRPHPARGGARLASNCELLAREVQDIEPDDTQLRTRAVQHAVRVEAPRLATAIGGVGGGSA